MGLPCWWLSQKYRTLTMSMLVAQNIELFTLALSGITIIGLDSGGQPGHAPPIIKMGAKKPFCPPIIRREFFLVFLLKKMKESRNRDKERKIQRKGSKF